MKRNNLVIIVMGVSGSGKTTIGRALAKKLSMSFYDADDFHPQSNIDKMKEGIPLNDEDRKPWLENLSELLLDLSKENGGVLACSALKEHYRKMLKRKKTMINWVYLKGSKDLIYNRLNKRKDHFFNTSLLDSQFATLDEPTYGIHVNIEVSEEEIISEILKRLE